jgi:RNA polymerase sigma factor (sigma-70 family)
VAALGLITGSREAAEDALQEALARAWERSERGEEIRSLGAWATIVALNLARNSARRGRFDLLLRGRLRRLDTVAAPTGDRVDLGRALAALPVRQREVTVLRYYLDLDVRAIADSLGVHEGDREDQPAPGSPRARGRARRRRDRGGRTRWAWMNASRSSWTGSRPSGTRSICSRA